jgi:hypothetical protein
MNFRSVVMLFIFCSLLSFLAGCKKENRCDCLKRTGDIILDKRSLSGFTKILAEENVDVYISQDSIFSVTVEAGEHIAPLITTEINGSTLVCKNKNRCNWTRSYKKPLNVYVHMPLLKEIVSNGTGNIKSLNTIQTDSCYVQTKNSGNIELSIHTPRLASSMHGSADLILHGKVNNHECDIGGTGYLKAADLQSGYTFLHTYTLGLCYIYVRDLLICRIDQIGDVFCYGNPKTVDLKLANRGKLYIQ